MRVIPFCCDQPTKILIARTIGDWKISSHVEFQNICIQHIKMHVSTSHEVYKKE